MLTLKYFSANHKVFSYSILARGIECHLFTNSTKQQTDGIVGMALCTTCMFLCAAVCITTYSSLLIHQVLIFVALTLVLS